MELYYLFDFSLTLFSGYNLCFGSKKSKDITCFYISNNIFKLINKNKINFTKNLLINKKIKILIKNK